MKISGNAPVAHARLTQAKNGENNAGGGNGRGARFDKKTGVFSYAGGNGRDSFTANPGKNGNIDFRYGSGKRLQSQSIPSNQLKQISANLGNGDNFAQIGKLGNGRGGKPIGVDVRGGKDRDIGANAQDRARFNFGDGNNGFMNTGNGVQYKGGKDTDVVKNAGNNTTSDLGGGTNFATQMGNNNHTRAEAGTTLHIDNRGNNNTGGFYKPGGNET